MRVRSVALCEHWLVPDSPRPAHSHSGSGLPLDPGMKMTGLGVSRSGGRTDLIHLPAQSFNFASREKSADWTGISPASPRVTFISILWAKASGIAELREDTSMSLHQGNGTVTRPPPTSFSAGRFYIQMLCRPWSQLDAPLTACPRSPPNAVSDFILLPCYPKDSFLDFRVYQYY